MGLADLLYEKAHIDDSDQNSSSEEDETTLTLDVESAL
jgi:hypothetical protein